MKKRIKKKKAYKKYIQSIFCGYESMLLDERIDRLSFCYGKEETQLTRDGNKKIHFLTRDKV